MRLKKYIPTALTFCYILLCTNVFAQNSNENSNEVKPDGEYTLYYDNGDVYRKGAYKDGVKEGEEITYTKTGQLWLTRTFVNGKKHGDEIKYFEDVEVVREKCVYNMGVKHGLVFIYDRSGNVKEKGKFVNGEFTELP